MPAGAWWRRGAHSGPALPNAAGDRGRLMPGRSPSSSQRGPRGFAADPAAPVLSQSLVSCSSSVGLFANVRAMASTMAEVARSSLAGDRTELGSFCKNSLILSKVVYIPFASDNYSADCAVSSRDSAGFVAVEPDQLGKNSAHYLSRALRLLRRHRGQGIDGEFRASLP